MSPRAASGFESPPQPGRVHCASAPWTPDTERAAWTKALARHRAIARTYHSRSDFLGRRRVAVHVRRRGGYCRIVKPPRHYLQARDVTRVRVKAIVSHARRRARTRRAQTDSNLSYAAAGICEHLIRELTCIVPATGRYLACDVRGSIRTSHADNSPTACLSGRTPVAPFLVPRTRGGGAQSAHVQAARAVVPGAACSARATRAPAPRHPRAGRWSRGARRLVPLSRPRRRPLRRGHPSPPPRRPFAHGGARPGSAPRRQSTRRAGFPSARVRPPPRALRTPLRTSKVRR
jgi:hypothetical protein